MSLRIACDLDGTVADMDAAVQREAWQLFGPEVDLRAPAERLESAEDVERRMAAGGSTGRPPMGRSLTPRELRRLWQHVAGIENFWSSLGEVEPGAVARLWSMAVQYRWEVIFLTQRPDGAGQTTQIQSQRWLRAHGFEWPNVMPMRGSRGKVADALALDVVLDDRPENCHDVIVDSKAKAILIWRFGVERLPPQIAGLDIQPVPSIAVALAHIEALTLERSRSQTVFGRLRRAFSRTP